MHLSDSQPGHWQPLQCHDGKSLLQHLRPTPMPFWASGDWHDDDDYYYYNISFYDMLLLYVIIIIYYYYIIIINYYIISLVFFIIIITIIWWWWWVISNNLDSNMETMGWQIVIHGSPLKQYSCCYVSRNWGSTISRYLWPAKDSLSHDVVHMAVGQNYRRWPSQFLCGS
jgi:hypothetical protein